MLNNLFRSYRITLGLSTFFILAVIFWQPHVCSLNSINFIKTIALGKKETHSLLLKTNKMIDQITREYQATSINKLNNKIIKTVINRYIISIRDILRSMLKQYSIDMYDINQLAVTNKVLNNLKISQQLFWILTNNDNLKHLIWEISHRRIRIYNHTIKGFKITNKTQHKDWINSVLKGTVRGNFISSAHSAGLSSREIREIIKVMQWQIDFCKLKKGDEFAVLVSHEIFDSNGAQRQMMGIHLRSKGKDYYAIRAKDGRFYNHDGIASFSNGFLRFPTFKQFRISSNFNLSRLNPVTGRAAPHRGVDFAMPQGTPILAANDGEVIVAKRSNSAGYYVTVRHGSVYTTRYMHLHKHLVKQGQKVKRGDRIALSGNTGFSTGPHLHYEVWINQHAVNPLTAKLPCIEGLTGKDRIEYLAQVKKMMPQLRFN